MSKLAVMIHALCLFERTRCKFTSCAEFPLKISAFQGFSEAYCGYPLYIRRYEAIFVWNTAAIIAHPKDTCQINAANMPTTLVARHRGTGSLRIYIYKFRNMHEFIIIHISTDTCASIHLLIVSPDIRQCAATSVQLHWNVSVCKQALMHKSCMQLQIALINQSCWLERIYISNRRGVMSARNMHDM